MEHCKDCGTEMTRKQAGESLSQIACYVPRRGHTNTLDWAKLHGPLCGECLTKWIVNQWGWGKGGEELKPKLG